MSRPHPSQPARVYVRQHYRRWPERRQPTPSFNEFVLEAACREQIAKICGPTAFSISMNRGASGG